MTLSITHDAHPYAAGMTSHASVGVMPDLEDGLDTEFPEELLTQQTSSTIDSTVAAVDGLAA